MPVTLTPVSGLSGLLYIYIYTHLYVPSERIFAYNHVEYIDRGLLDDDIAMGHTVLEIRLEYQLFFIVLDIRPQKHLIDLTMRDDSAYQTVIGVIQGSFVCSIYVQRHT